MTRAERRRQEKAEKRRKATYTLTKGQLDAMVAEQIDEQLAAAYDDGLHDAANTAMVLMLTLPLEVLIHDYWPKSYPKRIPEFIGRVLDLYEQWQDGELDLDELRKDLWEYGGVRLKENEVADK